MIIESSALSHIRNEAYDQSIALRFGCYDILHSGHQTGIDYAKAQADLLVIGVMPDEYVKMHKGPDRPINSQEVRAAAIDEASGVDFTFVAGRNELSIARFLLKLRPDVYVEEYEHANNRLKTVFLGSLGIRHEIDRLPRKGSTSAIIKTFGGTEALKHSSLTYSLR